VRTSEQIVEDYIKYRGKCKEYCEAAIAEDPTLTIVRGHYWDYMWGEQAHWWTVRTDGTIYDPTKAQFPSNGMGDYTPFNGIITCAQCGKEVPEEDAQYYGNYAFCSGEHIYAFVM